MRPPYRRLPGNAWPVWQGGRVRIAWPRQTTIVRELRVAASVVALLCLLLVAACGTIPPDDTVSPPSSSGAEASSVPSGDASGMGDECEYVQTGKAAKKVSLPPMSGVEKTGTLTFVMTTNEGAITITMDRATSPCTINSFASLVKQHYFDKTACHRLSDEGSFLLQCGDPTGTGSGGPGYTIPDELTGDETYPAGTVAMSRGDDPNTGGSQFFLVYKDSDLPPDYTIFGHLNSQGLNVVNKIAAAGQDGSYPDGSGRPKNPAKIISIAQS